MITLLFKQLLRHETDFVLLRKSARRLAELVGFESQDQTRIATAVSEIARNALEYGGGGHADFRLNNESVNPQLEIVVADEGPGIADLEEVLSGARRSSTGLGIGLIGARRLMDGVRIDSAPGKGTRVCLIKRLPRRSKRLTPGRLTEISRELMTIEPADPLDEVRRQNREILAQFEALQARQEELASLNQELQETNRGVVALYAELDERADHLRRADELKSRFLSNMSHEFRTPLNSILALSRLLLAYTDGPLAPEQEKQVIFVQRSAEMLTELVNDLLDLAKVEAGKTVVSPIEFTADSLFGALRGMLRPLLVGDAVALRFEGAEDIPPLNTDEGKISQILRNLISNAIKFTEKGEVVVSASYDTGAETVSFAVRDTGIGIAEADLELIFQEFAQVMHPRQRRIKGTGLGLPLSKKLAELLGGKISVSSRLGVGSVFELTVPREYGTSSADTDADVAWRVDPARVPILYLEDNAADAFALSRILVPSRYQALRVRNVAEARRLLDTVEPAVAILDIVLTGDESWRFLIELKQRSNDVPVLVTSATGDFGKALNLGADEYLEKPIDPDKLLNMLDRLTGHRSVTRVLVVDDQEISRYLVRQLLPRGVFDVVEAATGIEGLRRVQSEPTDIVLFDLSMPEMDGYEFLDRLSEASDVPAVVLTSAVLEQHHRRRLCRAARILSKSKLSSDELIAAIDGALKTRG
jgi:signal transduction histidine kinase/CheY-like chemotaxis protein